MTDETRWTGQVIVWALCAGILGHFAWTVYLGLREWRAEIRLRHWLEELALDQLRGPCERLSNEQIAERRR